MSSRSNRSIRETTLIEAWKLMMESMVKFIAASTAVMKSVASRVNIAIPGTANIGTEICEEDCPACPLRSPKECGICVSVDLQAPQASKRSVKLDKGEGTITKSKTSHVQATKDTVERNTVTDPQQRISQIEKATEVDVQQSAGDEKIEEGHRNCVCPEVKEIKTEAVKAGADVSKVRKRDVSSSVSEKDGCICSTEGGQCPRGVTENEGDGMSSCICRAFLMQGRQVAKMNR